MECKEFLNSLEFLELKKVENCSEVWYSIFVMTLKQFEMFTDDELAIILHVVNILNPPGVPKMEFEPHHLKWFKTDVLIPKLIAIFPKLKPEGHPIYLSLMEKLGVKGEIKYEQPPVSMPITASTEATGSIPLTGSNQVTGSNF